MGMCRSGDSPQELVLSFHCVGLGVQTQVGLVGDAISPVLLKNYIFTAFLLYNFKSYHIKFLTQKKTAFFISLNFK